MGSHNTIFTTAIHRMQIQKGGEKEDILLIKKHHSKTKGTTVDKIRNSFNLKLHNLLGFCK